MFTTTLSFANIHNHGELFANMLRARHELFIQHNRWDLPHAMGMEYDQYDTPASRWVVVHDELGQVLAGNRLTPTTTRCGIYSYMIRDAQRGLLDTIPANLLYEEAPVSETRRTESSANVMLFAVERCRLPLISMLAPSLFAGSYVVDFQWVFCVWERYGMSRGSRSPKLLTTFNV